MSVCSERTEEVMNDERIYNTAAKGQVVRQMKWEIPPATLPDLLNPFSGSRISGYARNHYRDGFTSYFTDTLTTV